MERVFKKSWPSEYMGRLAVQIQSITHSNRRVAVGVEKAISLRCICDLQRILNLVAAVPLQGGLICWT